jgi:hypothetical protein
MVHILKTPDGRKVVVNRQTDECLFKAARNPPNTGTAYTSGVDLYRHVSRKGNVYYYTYHWSMWQGSVDTYELITEEEAKQFLLKHMMMTGYDKLDEDEQKRAEELFPNIFEEDA